MLESLLPRDAPFMIEPIEAWRGWIVDCSRDHRGPFLRSITYRVPWPERKMMRAHCTAAFRASLKGTVNPLPRHDCPNNTHRCGIYALRDEKNIPRWANNRYHVGGKVRLWGRIYVYEHGFIAEYAYPISLTYVTENTELEHDALEILCEKYGIELEISPY